MREKAASPTPSVSLLNKGETFVFPFSASGTRKRWPFINQRLLNYLHVGLNNYNKLSAVLSVNNSMTL